MGTLLFVASCFATLQTIWQGKENDGQVLAKRLSMSIFLALLNSAFQLLTPTPPQLL